MTVRAERLADSFAALAEAGGSRVRPPRAAFTLLEILLALALMALLAAATVSVSADLMGKPAGPEEVFWQSLTEARKQALITQQEVRLTFDNKAKAFVMGVNVGLQTATDAGAQTIANAATQAPPDPTAKRFPVVKASDRLMVNFLPIDTTNSHVLIGGELIETDARPYVTFYGDGTCTPFRVQFSSGGPVRTISIDPWTCAEVLEVKK